MSDTENLPATVDEPDDDSPPSALAALRPHLCQYMELREHQQLSQEQCVETIFPGRYANAKDAGWRWEQRADYKAALAQIRAEAVKAVARGEVDVLKGFWKVADHTLKDGQIDPAGAMRALEALANYHGMTKTRTEISTPGGGPAILVKIIDPTRKHGDDD